MTFDSFSLKTLLKMPRSDSSCSDIYDIFQYLWQKIWLKTNTFIITLKMSHKLNEDTVHCNL